MREKVLLKVTGTLLQDQKTKQLTRTYIDDLARQIKQLETSYLFGIVVGGGAFFRGAQNNHDLRVRGAIAHTVGMFATVMSSMIFYDIFREHDINTTLLCGFSCPLAGTSVSQYAIDQACAQHQVIIFGGGTGNPYMGTTDTCAVIRAKQLGAQQVWKATNVDGVYTADPHQNHQAKLLPVMTYQEALDKKLQFMDSTAITLAQHEQLTTRVFNIFTQDALIHAARDSQWGTTVRI
jgi:uridylate kinase